MPTVTWDNDFEADPGDADAANQGANEIRKLKLGISERLELEMNFKTGIQPLIKAGIASVCYSGNTTQIDALSSPSANALAYNSQLTELQRYDSANWANMQLNHGTLANLTGTDPHTQYLKLDKEGQTLVANLAANDGVTIDGVDLSALSANVADLAPSPTFASHASGWSCVNSTVLTLTGNETWRTVTPPAGGGYLEWAALDDVPANADWIEVTAQIVHSTSVTPDRSYTVSLYAHSNEGTANAGGWNCVFYYITYPSSANLYIGHNVTRKIAIDTNKAFRYFWHYSSGLNPNVTLYLIGYGFNP